MLCLSRCISLNLSMPICLWSEYTICVMVKDKSMIIIICNNFLWSTFVYTLFLRLGDFTRIILWDFTWIILSLSGVNIPTVIILRVPSIKYQIFLPSIGQREIDTAYKIIILLSLILWHKIMTRNYQEKYLLVYYDTKVSNL